MSELPSLLLIDDSVEFLEILERRFRRRGFDVVACTDAATALACAAERKFDVALVDRHLRGDDGIALLKRLKQQQAEIAVLVLSGSSDGGAAQFALDAGAYEYLTKPCGLTELEAAVRRALEARISPYP